MKDISHKGYKFETVEDNIMFDYIKNSISESISVKEELLRDSDMLAKLAEIGKSVYNAVTGGNKVLICGNGGSAADAQHIAAELVGRFVCERRGLSAIALTTDSSILTAVGNDYGFNAIFERQVEALASRGDIVIGITTSGNSKNVLAALRKANELGAMTIGLLGGDGGEAAQLCDYSITIKSKVTARVQESHILCGHILCGIVDEMISKKPVHKAIFLDRDNTITVDSGYSHKVEDLKFLDGAVEALQILQSDGYKLVIITNQSGIGRNYFTYEDAEKFNVAMVNALNEEGVTIDKIQMCPHSPETDCSCRKPSPYMINQAAEMLNIDVTKSYMLGDKLSDVNCGENAGVKASCLVTDDENLLFWAKKIKNGEL